MELKQLEYFTIVCEKGSFSQAAECLYTSQPNVSKVISSLEKELGRKLVERSSRGLRITPYGETVRDYAKVILKHASLISSMATHHNGKKFTLATYPSNMITNLLVDFYRHWGNGYIVEHQEGSVEEVSNWVASGQTEIGIVYIAQRQLAAFRHILGHKNLEFEPIDVKRGLCLCGTQSPILRERLRGFLGAVQLALHRGGTGLLFYGASSGPGLIGCYQHQRFELFHLLE